MAENNKRIFLAINLPRNLKDESAELLDKLYDQYGKGVKWVNPNILHFTLHFLGNVSETQIKQVQEAARKLSGKLGRIEFEIGKINAFPNLNNPRVIFLECRQVNGDSVYKPRKELGKKLSMIGLNIDKRPWEPHITIGRVKRRVPGLNRLFSKPINLKKFIVDSFELMESKLKPDGPEYKIVESYKL